MTPQAWHDHAALALARTRGRPCPHPPTYRVPVTAQVKRGTGPWSTESGTACRACGRLMSLDNGWPGATLWADALVAT
jgi:hypothetical protein